MRRIAIMLVSAAAFASTSDVSVARDGCGPGRYFNGYRCVSQYPAYQQYPQYQQPYYGPNQRGVARNLGNGRYVDRLGNVLCYRPGFTVQDGVCKPYRGY